LQGLPFFATKKEARLSLRMGGLCEDPNHAFCGPVSLRTSSLFLMSETSETSPTTGNLTFVLEFLLMTSTQARSHCKAKKFLRLDIYQKILQFMADLPDFFESLELHPGDNKNSLHW
jgi:hypothetical protein